MMIYLHSLASPETFYRLARKLFPCLMSVALILLLYGVIAGLFFAPADHQQGEGYRIIYIHVPSAFLSLLIYSVMAFAAAVHLIWRVKLADMVVTESAVLGASFTFLALFSGALWGKPMWGTWWVWDARLTSELILFFLYLGFIALRSSLPDNLEARRMSSLLVVVGVVNLPIIHYSVYWWNTLHQGPTLRLLGPSLIASSMLYPLLAIIGGFVCYYIALLLQRTCSEVLWRERKTQWVKLVLKRGG